MKTLKNHTLIYDKDCPMCCAYTSAFIKTGVLDKEGREAYKPALFPDNPQFNAHKAQNEIALLNRQTGEVQYGIESMFAVIGHAAPILKPLFKFKPFKWFMKKVYSFISYNRKVIAPPPKDLTEINCVPDVNLKYRWFYIVFAVLLAGVFSGIGIEYGYKSGLGVGFGLMVTVVIVLRLALQSALVKLTNQNQRLLDYLGNLVTVNVQLAFLVALMFIIGQHAEAIPLFILIFASAFAILFHVRRLKSLGMNRWLCLAWNLQWVLIVSITTWAWA